MLIRKNTKAFKTIVEIITACQSRADREKLIRLYITRAGNSIHDRISVEGIQGEAALFYEMNYQTVLNNLKSANHQLHVSDDIPGIYFFHSSSNKVWDEAPFEFDEAIKKEFGSLPELPAVRKKEKAEKFIFPAPSVKTTSQQPPSKKEKVAATKVANIREKEARQPKQPDYKLKHKIHFTNLDKVIFRQVKISKKDIIDYYNKIAEYILPYLKDRPQLIRVHAESARTTAFTTSEALLQASVTLPDWIKTSKVSEQEHLLLCNDREHLLWYTEMGCIEFNPWHSRTKSPDAPDYIVIAIESPESELGDAIPAALAAKEILTGLKLPSIVKTDGMSGLHIYIPVDAKSKFEITRSVAEYICKLVALKIPDVVTLKGTDEYVYGKVSLDYTLNEEGQSVVAPYSLVPAEMPTVATPLLWEEVEDGLRTEDFNHETIFKRLKQVGDPFEALFKKKINGDALLERLEENYSFLF